MPRIVRLKLYHSTVLPLVACLLACFGSAAKVRAEDGGSLLQQHLADAGFRLLADEPEGLTWAAETLGLTEAQKVEAYDWLRGQAKPEAGRALECRLLAWLASDLKRSPEERNQADDLLLRARPALTEAWVRRAGDHAESGRPEAESWAVESYLQGLRRTPLAAPGWRQLLQGGGSEDWLAKAVKAGQTTPWVRALEDALHSTPTGEARLDAATLVLAALRSPEVLAVPDLAEALLQATGEAQPQVVFGDVMGFVEVMRTADKAGRRELSRLVARLLALAPVAEETAGPDDESASAFTERWNQRHPAPAPPAATGSGSLEKAMQTLSERRQFTALEQAAALRTAYRTLNGTWEDTMPRYQPFTLAHDVLLAAMGTEREAFATESLERAQTQAWNENLAAHALLATAMTTGIEEPQAAFASRLDTMAKGRLALRLHAFAPKDHPLPPLIMSWVEAAALEVIQKAQGVPMERSVYESLLLSMDCLERAGSTGALEHVLHAALKTLPRTVDVEHWRRLAQFVISSRQAGLSHEFSDSWLAALKDDRAQKDHLLAVAETASQAGPACGQGFAEAALTLWNRQYGAATDATPLDAATASRVAEAQMACGNLDGFHRLVTGLRDATRSRLRTTLGRTTDELLALDRLLEGDDRHPPAVEAWVQAPAAAGLLPVLQWQFVLPELGEDAGRPLILTTGDRDSLVPSQKLRDARWWKAGTALPALAKLAGRFRLVVMAGESPDRLNQVASLEAVGWQGSAPLKRLPAAGYLKSALMAGGQFQPVGETRPYSILPALTTTGAEPSAAPDDGPPATGGRLQDIPAPASWQPDDTARWGRLTAPPVPVQAGTEYLLSEWAPPTGDAKPSKVRMILLDENQKPLGPVPMASMGPPTGYRSSRLEMPAAITHRGHLQLFRPSNWAGDGDLVFRRKEAQGPGHMDARYVAFVTRDSGEAPLPVMQLRTFKESASGWQRQPAASLMSKPELNDEHVADMGFHMHSWHLTMTCDRGVMAGKGQMAAFDMGHIPWRPVLRSSSPLLEGNEWPMCFEQSKAMVVEPAWNGGRDLAVRFVPFDARGERYAACERIKLPLPTYDHGEFSEHGDGVVLMVSSIPGDHPEPVCAWVEPDGKCHVVPLPRPPLKGKPGLEMAWWGPEGSRFTLHEDGLLFEMEHLNTLRLVSVRPGSPDDMPKGASGGRSRRKREWMLERPDVLAQRDRKSGQIIRRYHLSTPCEGQPMSYDRQSYVFLCTLDHEIIRVNPPRSGDDDD